MNVELILSATRTSWAVPATHGSQFGGSKRIEAVRARVLARDNNTCAGCQWKSQQWQEIHHLDHDHRNMRLDNLKTLCPLCHQVFHLPQAASTGGGNIIWLPEISQAQLNRMCIPLFVAMSDPKHAWHGAATSIYGDLEACRETMESAFGQSDPSYLAQVLLNMSKEQYSDRARVLAPIRLLAHPSRFPYEIEYWKASAFDPLPDDTWERFVKALAA